MCQNFRKKVAHKMALAVLSQVRSSFFSNCDKILDMILKPDIRDIMINFSKV